MGGLLSAVAKACLWWARLSSRQQTKSELFRRVFAHPLHVETCSTQLTPPPLKRAAGVCANESFRFAQVKSFRGINPRSARFIPRSLDFAQPFCVPVPCRYRGACRRGPSYPLSHSHYTQKGRSILRRPSMGARMRGPAPAPPDLLQKACPVAAGHCVPTAHFCFLSHMGSEGRFLSGFPDGWPCAAHYITSASWHTYPFRTCFQR